MCVCVCVCVCVVHSISFQTFFVQALSQTFKIKYVIAIHLLKWLSNSYDFRFKLTTTVGIGIHLTKARLSQLVNFKNAIWT